MESGKGGKPSVKSYEEIEKLRDQIEGMVAQFMQDYRTLKGCCGDLGGKDLLASLKGMMDNCESREEEDAFARMLNTTSWREFYKTTPLQTIATEDRKKRMEEDVRKAPVRYSQHYAEVVAGRLQPHYVNYARETVSTVFKALATPVALKDLGRKSVGKAGQELAVERVCRVTGCVQRMSGGGWRLGEKPGTMRLIDLETACCILAGKPKPMHPHSIEDKILGYNNREVDEAANAFFKVRLFPNNSQLITFTSTEILDKLNKYGVEREGGIIGSSHAEAVRAAV